MTIDLVGAQFSFDLKQNSDAPRFDIGSVSDTTLQMKEDEESGSQFFTPVFLICITQGSLALPKIEGEEEGESFEVIVSLEEASDLVEYLPLSRQFKLLQSF